MRWGLCGGRRRGGGWTEPPLEVTTQRAPTPQRPHTIGFSQLRATSVVVTWSAAANTGGVPLTGFDITYWPYDAENPDRETGATTQPADGGTDRGETLRGLAASTEYEVKMRACNGPKDRHCSSWSADHRFTTLAGTTPTPTPTPEAPRPQNLDLTPRGDQRARLSWTWSGSKMPDDYRVTARVFGLAGEPSDSDLWHQVITDHSASAGTQKDQHREIELDRFVKILARGTLGLAHHAAYEIRVEAVFGTPPIEGDPDSRTYSPPSDQIIVIDTPITLASGSSSSTVGKSRLTFDAVETILGKVYGSGVYTFRYRKVETSTVPSKNAPHTSIHWAPNAYTSVDPTTDNPKTGLELKVIYGVQLVFVADDSTDPLPTVFAGRDAYVWPSSQSPRLRERVASFPIGWDAVDDGTYTYRICHHTLPQANRMGWHGFIKHAMGHWGSVTSGRIKAEFESGDCEDYSPLIDRAVRAAMSLTRFSASDDEASPATRQQIRSELQAGIAGMFESLAQMGYDFGRSGTSIREINEVRMITFTDDNEDLLAAAAFPQISKNIGLPGCGFTAQGCAIVSDGHADIFINHLYFTNAELNLPSGFRLDRCLDSSGVPMEGVDVKLYGTIVHEVAHVFGINYPPESDTQ
ncbi:MAG: fibronectin type III domain-containing protein [Chloroflexota bacterium]|nr:fibronectin type III domain-containing protein [Chloroflexota bacterium]